MDEEGSDWEEERSQSEFDPVKEVGGNFEQATLDFVKECELARVLRIPGGQTQLSTNDFITYLGVNVSMEPELSWVAREMCAAPMPPNAEMLVSKSKIVYFHDRENDYYTVEHPLTQRYLKILERARLDALALRTKPAVDALVFHQPDVTFHTAYRNLQVPCQDCGVVQSTIKCQQCLMSFCDACHANLHTFCEGPRKYHTSLQTACGSFCSACAKKKPQVYCGNCEDYFCTPCFEAMHRKGHRTGHRVMMVNVSDAEVVDPKKCEECEDNIAAFHCDQCLDNFCIPCFWRFHMNGVRRKHTVTKVTISPLCNQCNKTRATVFCEQCQELLCTDCFTYVHYKGNRQLHLCMDAMNLLLLLERLDPGFEEHLRRARPRIVWGITTLQGWTRGIESRKMYRRHQDVVSLVHKRWRGAMTRKKLLGMLDQYKWRKKEINNFFLPKTAQDRAITKQRFAAQYGRKDVAQKTAQGTLRELRDTIVASAQSNQLEDASRTKTVMEEAERRMDAATKAETTQYVLPVYSSITDAAKSGGGKPKALEGAAGQVDERAPELTRQGVASGREQTLKQMLRIDQK